MASSATSLPSSTPTSTPTSASPTTTPTTPSTTPTTPTPTPTTNPSTTPTPTSEQSGISTATFSPGTPNTSTDSSNGSTPQSSPTNTATPTSVTSTLSVASTSVGESTTLATSDNGQVYTKTVAFTTTLPPGTVVTSSSIAPPSTHSSTNIGAIVGGVVGGLAALIIFALLVFFCLRKRRRDEFDGNFDPAHVTSVKGGGGGTLPKIDLGEGGIMGDSGGRLGVVDDDGMGGRLGASAGGGGIIMPYSFVPPVPVGGSGVGAQYQNPQMQQMSNVGAAIDGVAAAGYGNEKRAMRQQHAGHTSSASVSSGSHYPTTVASSANPNYQHLHVNNASPEPYSPTSDRSSAAGENYYGPHSMGRGPSPGPSLLSSSSGARNMKEMEAMGSVIANPDEGQSLPAFQQAYLQTGPGPHQQQQQQHYMSSSSSPVPSQLSPTPSRAGTAVVVHEDGGRVVLRKGGEVEAEAEVAEIPPTYDSLPVDVRRDS